jgi:hypothetical protein
MLIVNTEESMVRIIVASALDFNVCGYSITCSVDCEEN